MARVPWALTAFVLVMLPVVVALGLWQLDRAKKKAVLEDAFINQLGSPVRTPDSSIAAFAHLALKGRYGREQYLVDNQVLQGRVGYWVLQAFDALEGQRFIVNRGWIEAPVSRDALPVVETPAAPVEIVVLAWPQMGLPLILGDDEWPIGEKIRVQRRDIVQMAQRSNAYPMEMRLEAGSPGALRVAPADLEFGRERHIGYAIQWFGLGAVLAIGWVLVYRRGKDRTQNNG